MDDERTYRGGAFLLGRRRQRTDGSASHYPRTAAEQAAWSAALRRLLPPPPAKVLDVGAGTGFVSILLARQGYTVTALELAPGMLARLEQKARDAGLEVRTTEGDAADPPRHHFDAVVERHLLWTLLGPGAALDALAPGRPHRSARPARRPVGGTRRLRRTTAR